MNVDVELVSVVVGTLRDEPAVLVLPRTDDAPRLPAGPLEHGERSLQAGTRRWVEQLTGHRLGYLEQLYTFADADRGVTSVDETTALEAGGRRSISIGYLALTRITQPDGWLGWYDLLPWEDRRDGRLPVACASLTDSLRAWAGGDEARRRRVHMTFGLDGEAWVPDLALQRYELLYEAGLVAEAWRGRPDPDVETSSGTAMFGDHRRIVATATARLRAKIQYRPVVFELLPEAFTLAQLQRVVEAIAGSRLHTQNFRRQVEQQHLVEPTGGREATGGRPAQLFRFRTEVRDARAVAGTKVPTARGAR